MMISVRPDDTYTRTFQELTKYLPKFDDSDVDIVDRNGAYCAERKIPLHYADLSFGLETAISLEWKNMYHIMTMRISEIIMKSDEYFIVRMTPYVHDNYDPTEFGKSIILGISTEMHIAGRRDEVISIWTYEYVEKEMHVEWRCGACSTPNVPEQRWCTQCGTPRALLVQEMMCVHCGTPRDDDSGNCSQCGAEYINL